MAEKRTSTHTDMTEGSIVRHILAMAIPMILGNYIQLTYNLVDSVVVGKLLGAEALAAVSTSNPVMTLMVMGTSGIGIGAGIIMSRLFGAREYGRLKREFSTTLIFSTGVSLFVFLVGIFLSRNILLWINTPAESLPMAVTYLRTVLFGFLFTFLYNILSCAMRSIGDSRSPVLFLGIACGLNVLMDLLFIGVFSLGVFGAALATVLSQAISVVLCMVWIYRRIPELSLKRNEFAADTGLLKETVASGALVAMQQTVIPLGKLFVQSAINSLGVVAVGAFNAASRVDDFFFIPATSIANGITTCTAQNLGAEKFARVNETFKKGLAVELCYFPVAAVISLLVRRPAVRLLCPDGSQVMIDMAILCLNVKLVSLVIGCTNNALQGWSRGIGKLTIVFLASAFQITIRAILTTVLAPKIGVVGEAFACMAGWTFMCLFELCCLYVLKKKGELPHE